MGVYILLSTWNIENMRKVEDKDIQEVFEEALAVDKSLMIDSSSWRERKKWYKKKETVREYSIYHEQFSESGKSLFEARQQLSASGSKKVVLAYLYGIINGNIIKNGR